MTAKSRELRLVGRPGVQVYPMSGATGAGVPNVVQAVTAALSATRMAKDRGATEASPFVDQI
jgi:hypothetical protein